MACACGWPDAPSILSTIAPDCTVVRPTSQIHPHCSSTQHNTISYIFFTQPVHPRRDAFMNVPPTEFIRVAPDALHDFVKTASTTVGLSEDKADLLARLLVDNDKRGVFSHGTTQIAT